VYDKTVRRRRAVLAVLVGLSLVLLTAYFGESANGGLHSLQRGVLSVLAPIQEGANRALKPVRDLAGWFGDTLDAKGQRDKLKHENQRLRQEVIGRDAALRENAQLRRTVGFDQQYGLSSYTPVQARVIGRSPNLWFATLTIDKGSSAGVHVDQPVTSPDGLVGRVSAVGSGFAQVTLITDHTSAVSARVNEGAGVAGVLKTEIGKPNDLLLDFVARGSQVSRGQRVVTAGSRSQRLESLFPPDIPIGEVTKVDAEELALYQRVHVRPFAQLRTLDFVQVLTRPHAAGQQASAP
jgi:rod shape-determining protein MreC